METELKEITLLEDQLKELRKKIEGKISASPRKLAWNEITTFEQACANEGHDAQALREKWAAGGDTEDEIAYKEIKIIVKALNSPTFKAEWGDTDQKKWWPYFDTRHPSGFGFSDSDCDRWRATTACGSRLCLESKEKSDYFGVTFCGTLKKFII